MGDMVIVDCTYDQIDLGIVFNVFTAEEYVHHKLVMGEQIDREDRVLVNIIRKATDEDRYFLPVKHEQEKKLVQTCQYLVERFRLPMNIYGVEYQLDGKKVSVFYTSETRVDYKALVRELHNYCQVHIWIRRTHPGVQFNPNPLFTEALITGCPINSSR